MSSVIPFHLIEFMVHFDDFHVFSIRYGISYHGAAQAASGTKEQVNQYREKSKKLFQSIGQFSRSNRDAVTSAPVSDIANLNDIGAKPKSSCEYNIPNNMNRSIHTFRSFKQQLFPMPSLTIHSQTMKTTKTTKERMPTTRMKKILKNPAASRRSQKPNQHAWKSNCQQDFKKFQQQTNQLKRA